jgi:NADH-quinone oxidoreductase subunit H
MRFALFFLGEYAGMITTSAICVALFFGGWDFWGLRGPSASHPEVTTYFWISVARVGIFYLKTLVIIFVFMWVRWSLPRFRFDQLMMLAWRALIPISLLLLMMTAILVFCFHGRTFDGLDTTQAVAFFMINVFFVGVLFFITPLLPPAPATNRKLRVIGSRFTKTPLPAGPAT